MDTHSKSASSDVLLFACAGGSNVGQISNDAAIALERAGAGSLFCLAGVGGHVEGIVDKTRAAGRTVAIDGCDIHCVRKTLEAAGVDPTVHIVITNLGIEKAKTYEYPEEHVCRVVDAVLHDAGDCPGAGTSSAGACCDAEGGDDPTSCCEA
jgi:uncharacterized metal-binding protein